MPHEYEDEGNGGTGFMMGLLTGTVLGAGLGMLFAPRAGSELRRQISDAAGEWRHTAGEQYRRATEAAGSIAERGREVYDRARSAVSKGAEEARRYVSETEREAGGMHPSSGQSMGSESGTRTGTPTTGTERFSPGGTRA